MKTKARKSCPNCQRLLALLKAQETRLKALEATVALLQVQLAAAKKNSATSSKPPSSDIVKPPKPSPPEGQAQRKIGGQPGHPKHEREPFPPGLSIVISISVPIAAMGSNPPLGANRV
jgi:hypothetical protein